MQEAEESTKEYEPTQVLPPFWAELCKSISWASIFIEGEATEWGSFSAHSTPSWVVTFFWSWTAHGRWAATWYNQGKYFVGCINVQVNYRGPSLFTATFWIIYNVWLVSSCRPIERNGKLIFFKYFNFHVAFAVVVNFI